MNWLFDEIDDAIYFVNRLKKSYIKFQKLINDDGLNPSGSREKSVIAQNEHIKGKDETVSGSPIQNSGPSHRQDEVIELELCSDGVYRPKRSKLDQK